MKNLFFLLALTTLLTSCSSKFDPDIAFKGKIDENFLTAMSRGEIPVSLIQNCSESYIYTKPYVDGHGVGDWEEWDGDGWSVSNPNIFVFNGCSWNVYNPTPHLTTKDQFEDVITTVWLDYKEKTGYNKSHFIKCTFEIDIPDKKVMIGERWYKIESANNGMLVLSSDGYAYGSGLKITSLVKHIYTYYNKPEKCFNPENDEAYETIKDATLARLRLMIEYFGDVWTKNTGNGVLEIKLAKIEELFLAGKSRWEDLTDEEKDDVYLSHRQ